MTFDFTKLQPVRSGPGDVDPIQLFRSLQVRDQAVNDLWMGQGDALRQWHEHRQREDVAIVLNTGAGKTLVGLLAAQSLVNEIQGHVAYVCASIQLVQQTASKAESYGLSVSTYFEQTFSDSRFHEGTAACVTTYQALFNGLTHKWDDVNAIVFDDAHAATHIIRDQFTLHLDRARHQAVYNAIATALGEHLRETDSAIGFREAMERQDPNARWFIPPFVIKRNIGDVGRALMDARLDLDGSAKFAWGYLRDKIDLCAAFITPRDVSFTPPVVPVRSLPYFRSGVRRVYLSATLAADDAFLRTFGKVPDRVVSPGTPAGQCERMIIIPGKARGVVDDVLAAKTAIQNSKALIMVPTHRDGVAWDDVAATGLTDTAAQVEQFKQAAPPTKLRLVARYDGVDLPGDTCRVMVIHGLPSGLGPLERFMWEKLRLHGVLRSTVASRIVQSFGRISRGMADHGVVVIVGTRLVEWLLTPANRRALPGFLRRQVELGFQVSEQVDTSQLPGLAQQCLTRDQAWLNFYGSSMAGVPEESPQSAPAVAEAAAAEVEFGLHLWHREYAAAAGVLHRNRQKLFSVGTALGAWYMHWEGYLHELLGKAEEATALYQQARKADKAMPSAVKIEIDTVGGSHADAQQLNEIARYLLANPRVLQSFDQETGALDGGSVPQTEEAVRCLGTYLGLCSSRPDNDQGSGPDVLWYLPAKTAWSLELKTDKQEGVAYSKKNVMQAMDHVQWVRDNHEVDVVVPIIVGPHQPADARANPPDALIVMDPAALRQLRDRLRAAIENVLSNYLPVTLRAEVAKVLGAHGLLWSQLSSAVPGLALRSLN